MKRRILIAILILSAFPHADAQDARTVLQAAAKAMGAENLKSIRYTGSGWIGAVGQNYAPERDWPRFNLPSYSRTIDFATKSSREEYARKMYVVEGQAYQGGGLAPFEGEQKSTLLVSGSYAWSQEGARVIPQPAAAEIRQLEIWLTPHGFIQGAMEAAASNNATAIRRHEYGEWVTIVSFQALGKFRVNGTIDSRNLVIRTQTWFPNPVVGDMYQETVYSNYRQIGGVMFPGRFHQHHDHDDNDGMENPSWGVHSFGLENIASVEVNVTGAALTVPAEVRSATVPPVRVEAQKLAAGVWLMGGGSHNSVAIEFQDYTVVVEAPQNEERSLAVIAEVYKLIPNKPIRFLVNTHHHWDHIGGMRTYVHEGATVIAHERFKRYFQEILSERIWTLQPDRLSLYPPEELAEGYIVEAMREHHQISDGSRVLDLYSMQGPILGHSGAMVIAYLPKEKILIQGDLFSPPAPGAAYPAQASQSQQALFSTVKRLKLAAQTIAPIHGRVVPMSDFTNFMERVSR